MKKLLKNILVIARPLMLGIVGGVIIWHVVKTSITIPRLEFLLDTIISSSATISGFILASVTILVGATSSKIMREIKSKLALPELRWRYSEALILGLMIMIYFTCLGVLIDNTNEISRAYLSISTALLLSYFYSVVATCYYLLSIIGKINEDPAVIEEGVSSPDGEYR